MDYLKEFLRNLAIVVLLSAVGLGLGYIFYLSPLLGMLLVGVGFVAFFTAIDGGYW